MDASLNLPPQLYSHGVQRFVAEHAAIMSFDDVRHELLSQTGARVPKRQVDENAVRAAVDFDAFYAERRAAEALVEAPSFRDLLVMTFNGEGIVMMPEALRAATKKAAEKSVRKLASRLIGGEKRNRKRMAQVAAIYTVARHLREPADVLADLNGTRAEDARPKRPQVRMGERRAGARDGHRRGVPRGASARPQAPASVGGARRPDSVVAILR